MKNRIIFSLLPGICRSGGSPEWWPSYPGSVIIPIPSLNQPDGIHPNFAGVKVIVNNILPFVVDLIPHD
jgi:lysophospholipase L1-like esterase